VPHSKRRPGHREPQSRGTGQQSKNAPCNRSSNSRRRRQRRLRRQSRWRRERKNKNGEEEEIKNPFLFHLCTLFYMKIKADLLLVSCVLKDSYTNGNK
jgi:hypothetical protein